MGQVVPFIARVRDSGDWTAAERARLEDLADRLAASGVHVEVIFGATDDGDPWCVVTDESGDVLIHVARIDGRFVVHSAVDDAINEGADLHAALRDQLDATEAALSPQSATILPFGLTARQGQTFLALVAAAAFFHETSGVADSAQAATLPPEVITDPTPPPPDIEAPTQERELAAQGAAQQPAAADPTPASTTAAAPAPEPQAAAETHEDPAAEPTRAPLEPATVQSAPAEPVLDAPKPAARAEPAILIQGTDGDDRLVGTSADEHIVGGAGNDTLSGGGGHDLLEGGAGDDRIELTSGTIAVGGQGADTFVIEAPTELGHAKTLLGVILDFSTFDGDKIVTASGRVIELPLRPATDGTTLPGQGGQVDRTGGTFTSQDFLSNHPTLGPTTSGGTGQTAGGTFGQTLTRVEIDLNGDGVIDGFILVGRNGHVVGGADNAVVVTGHALTNGADLFG